MKFSLFFVFSLLVLSTLCFLDLNRGIGSDSRMIVESRDDEKVLLGKRLFFDPVLSGSNRLSCSSCHIPSYYFSDSLQHSFGENGHPTPRHSMSLLNIGRNGFFFWDGRVKTLEDQIFVPINNEFEMNQPTDELISELSGDPSYIKQFEQAFHENVISKSNIAIAIARYLRTLVSNRSPLDSIIASLKADSIYAEIKDASVYKRALLGPKVSDKVVSALNLCEKCHSGNNYGGNTMRNNGLSILGNDSGYYTVTKNPVDIGKFKVVSLRNVERTAPYMHDGRFKTLKEVIEHYNSGIEFTPTLDSLLHFNGKAIKLGLNDSEVDDVIVFLNLLTDENYLME